jgi:hypothetical protein
MSAAPPSRESVAEPDEVLPITLLDGIRLRVPLGYVVEPDRLCGELAMEALMESYAAEVETEVGVLSMVARWTRSRGWVSFGSGFDFALVGADPSAGQPDLLDEIVRLSEHLSTARLNNGAHPFQRALFAVRASLADLQRSLAGEVLLDAVRQLMSCNATLLVELDGPPGSELERLGQVFRSPGGAGRFVGPVAAIGSAARAAGVVEPDHRALNNALSGLSLLQGELVARLVEAECRVRGTSTNVLHLIAAARQRIGAVAGAGE